MSWLMILLKATKVEPSAFVGGEVIKGILEGGGGDFFVSRVNRVK